MSEERQFVDSVFKGRDGHEFRNRCWEVTDGRDRIPGAVLCIVHGLGEHIGRYESYATSLRDVAIPICGYDHRGHGKSGGKRGQVNGVDELTDDLEYYVEKFLVEECGYRRIILLGHSLGGLVVANYATTRDVSAHVVSLVLSSPALLLPKKFSNSVKLFFAKYFLNKAAPQLVLGTGLNPKLITSSPSETEAYRSDPLIHYKISVRLGYTMITTGKAVVLPEAASRIRLPILAWHGLEDHLADKAGPEQLMAGVSTPKADAKLVLVPKAYHELHHEFPQIQEQIFGELRDWIEKYVPADDDGSHPEQQEQIEEDAEEE